MACVGNLITQSELKRENAFLQFNVAEFTVLGLMGYSEGSLAGTMPDVLEPANHPGHRDFCHSVTAGVLLAVGTMQLNKNPDVSQRWKTVANIVTVGYLMHLYADAQTPARLPWFTKG